MDTSGVVSAPPCLVDLIQEGLAELIAADGDARDGVDFGESILSQLVSCALDEQSLFNTVGKQREKILSR